VLSPRPLGHWRRTASGSRSKLVAPPALGWNTRLSRGLSGRSGSPPIPNPAKMGGLRTVGAQMLSSSFADLYRLESLEDGLVDAIWQRVLTGRERSPADPRIDSDRCSSLLQSSSLSSSSSSSTLWGRRRTPDRRRRRGRRRARYRGHRANHHNWGPGSRPATGLTPLADSARMRADARGQRYE